MTKKRIIVVVSFGLVFLFLVLLGSRFWQTEYRRRLPVGVDFQEQSNDLFVDYEYFLAAELDEPQFQSYVSEFNLKPVKTSMRVNSSMLPEWWPRQRHASLEYREEKSNSVLRVFYQDGTMFLFNASN